LALRHPALAVGALAFLMGCATVAREAGEEATEGALATLAGEEGKKGKAPDGGRAAGPVGEGAAGAAATGLGAELAAGIVDQLARPAPLEDVEALSERAGAALARSFARELAIQLGDRGEGSLVHSLAVAGEGVAAGAVRGAAGELGTAFPECRGPDSGACIRRQIEELGRSGARGALRGAGPWPYLLAAAGGAALALLAVAAVGGAGARRSARRLEVRRAGA
jgi:hypothetical protein